MLRGHRRRGFCPSTSWTRIVDGLLCSRPGNRSREVNYPEGSRVCSAVMADSTSSQPISFLSDFGHADEFVGVVHGVIGRIAAGIRVIDVGHDVPRGDIRAGALMLLRSIQYLPNGVVLAVVDPGVGTERRSVAVRTKAGRIYDTRNATRTLTANREKVRKL